LKEQNTQIVNKAKAEADAAYDVQYNTMKQNIVREIAKQEVIKSKILLEVENIKAEAEKELKTGESFATLIKEKNIALGVEAMAQANANKITWYGQSEADAITAMGNANAEILVDKAKAYKSFGQAAIVQSVVEKLPAVAENLTKPLRKTDKMMIISSSGKTASGITKDVTEVLAQIPGVIRSLTGVDISKGLDGELKN